MPKFLRQVLFLPVLLALPAAAAAQEVDTTRAPIELKEITVTVTRQQEPQSRVPMAVDVLGRDAIQKGQLTLGLDEALNNLPGVYVANRYNFSLDQRLSIRGFGSRSNFGIRGVKVLLDGVPQTLPDGQSQLTNVDFATIDRVEVLRGSASSLYGNASGGVIALTTEPAAAAPLAARLRVEGGDFGTFKWQGWSSARSGAASGTLSVSRFTTDGFRQHGAADLRQLSLGGDYVLSGSTIATLRFAAGDAPKAENPGALTQAEYDLKPDSAAANNILRKADKDVDQQQLSLGLRHLDADGNDYQATVFGFLRNLANPLATNFYNTIDRKVGGVRLSGSHRLGAGATALRLTAGADLQRMRDDRVQYLAALGVPTDSTTVDQLETVTEIGPFAQLLWTPTERLLVGAGGRYDWVKFKVQDRKFTDPGGDNSGNRVMKAASGNLGVSFVVSDALIPYLNVSTSFETPTTVELVNQPGGAGGFNDALGPQRAYTYEAGFRGRDGTRVTYSAAFFLSRISDAIVQFSEVGGQAFFRNAGKVRNDGLELGLSMAPTRGLSVFGSYTYAHYRFTNYRFTTAGNPVALDGNTLPGVPAHFLRLGLRSEFLGGGSLDVDQTISSKLFADDANTIVAEGWGAGVTNLRAAWDARLGGTRLLPFLGVNNLWDRQYVGSVTINAFGGRVFESAPRRNAYAGMEVGWGR